MLFIAYINEICNNLPGIKLPLYADDKSLIISNKNYNKLKENCESTLNTEKTKILHFHTIQKTPENKFIVLFLCKNHNRNTIYV